MDAQNDVSDCFEYSKCNLNAKNIQIECYRDVKNTKQQVIHSNLDAR